MKRRKLSPRRGVAAHLQPSGGECARRDGPPLVEGTAFQLGIVVMLMVQNASDPLLMQKANNVPGVSRDGAPVFWSSQTGVMVNQLLKLAVSLPLALYSGERLPDVAGAWSDVARSALPSLLFLLQGNLQFAAIQHLDAATYAALAQLKILAAALFAVLLLRRPLPGRRWLALGGLVLGLILVQRSSSEPPSGGAGEPSALERLERSRALALGVGFSVACSCLSGLSGVYTEIILKESRLSLWARNVHFSTIGCLLSVAGLVATGEFRRAILEGHFFDGYTPWCWACIVNRSLGGLLVSMVTKYASNLAKHLACAVAMVVTCLGSVLLGRPANWEFATGIAVVCLSTTLYNVAPPVPKPSVAAERKPRRRCRSLAGAALALAALVGFRQGFPRWDLRLGLPVLAAAASDQALGGAVHVSSTPLGEL